MTKRALIDAALAWAEAGVPVFPTAKDKRPITENGHKDASTDPAVIERLFAASGAWGIGGAMGRESGLFAVDSDHYKPGDAGASAAAFVASLQSEGLLPKTRVHTTQSGGTHYLFRSSTDWPNCKPCAGVEVKGEGGYIILPPTPGYTVLEEGVAKAPKGLILRLNAARAQASATASNALKQRVLEGEDFHDSLTLLAARMAAAGTPPERVQAELLDLLAGSVARDPAHPRHDRWINLYQDRSKELSRLVFSAEAKFNPDTAAQALREAAAGKFGTVIPQPASFFVAPTGAQEEEDPVQYDGAEWPFAKDRGYFGHEDVDVLDQQFVVYPILVENETTLISAEPKAGKTLVAQTIAMHIAAGMDLGEMKVYERRPVIYFALESQVAIKKRIKAWKKTHDPKNDLFNEANFQMYVAEMPVNLMDKEVRAKVAKKIAAADLWFQNEGAAPIGAIVIDTLTKAMPGGDQNSVEDTSLVFEIIQEIREMGVRAPVVFIHHNRKDSGAPRGSSNILAEPDTLLTLAKNTETDQLHLKIYMARSIDDDMEFVFDVRSVNLGKTQQGYDIEAPVLFPAAVVRSADDKVVEDLKIEMAYTTMFKELVALGVGTHPIKAVHSHLRTSLPDDLYGRVKTVWASSPEYLDFFTTIVPVTGRSYAGHNILPVVQKDRNKLPKLVSVEVRRLAG